MDIRKISDVIEYLKHCDIAFSNYYKTQDFIYKHELLISDLVSMVRSLTTTDLIKGPVSDEDIRKAGYVYIFKKRFGKISSCYIKIRVENETKPTIVISIHDDEYNY